MTYTSAGKCRVGAHPVGPVILCYGLALAATAVAIGVRVVVRRFLGCDAPALLFYPVVATAAWFGGLGPGLAATALGAFALSPLLSTPYGVLGAAPAAESVRMALFAFVGAQVSWLIDSLRRQRERAAEAERILDALMEHVPEGILIAEGIEGRVRRVSRCGAEMAGLPHAAAEGLGMDAFQQGLSVRRPHDSAPPPVAEMPLFRAVHGGEVIADEEWILGAANGAEIPILCTAGPVRDERGNVLGGILTWRDISGRKRAERDRERLLAILDSSPDIIAMATVEGPVVYLNPAAREVFGLPEGGDPQIRVGDHRPEWAVRKIIDEGIPAATRDGVWRGETAILRHDGVEVPVSQVTVAHRDAGGRAEYFSTIMRDISAAKEAERERERLLMDMAAQHDLLHSVVRYAPVGIALLDGPEHRFVLANLAYETWAMAYGRGEIVGRTVSEVWPEIADTVVPLLDGVRASGQALHAQDAPFWLERDGRRGKVHFTFTYEPLNDAAGCVGRILVVAQETTVQVAARECIEELGARAEAARARLETVIGQMPSGVVITEVPSGKTLIANDAVRHIWRHDALLPDDADRFTLLRGFHADGRPYAPEEWPLARAVRLGETVIGEEIEIERGDGTRATTRSNAAPVRDAEGRVVAGVVVFHDVTESKRMEESLRESEARLRLAIEAADMAPWHWDLRTGEITCSAKGNHLLGLDAGHPVTMDLFRGALHPEDRDRLDRRVARLLSGEPGERVDYRVVWPDGSVHWISLQGRCYWEQGEAIRIEGVAFDITERKQALERIHFLAEASSVLASPLDCQDALNRVVGLVVPMLADVCALDVVEDDGEVRRIAVVAADPHKQALAEGLRGYPPALPRPVGVAQVLATGKPLLLREMDDALLARAAQDEPHLQIMRELSPQSGVIAPLLARGRILGALSLLVTDASRRYSDDDLAVAEELGRRIGVAIDNARLYGELQRADQRKDEFLAMLAHELRNPLSSISSGLHLVKTRAGRQPRTLRAVEGIIREVRHMARLVEDLLDVSRVTRGKVAVIRKRMDLRSAVDAAVQTSRPGLEARGHNLSVSLPWHPLMVEGDLDRLIQVFGNLLDNAAKYTPPGGRIWVSGESDGHDAVIRVSDSGVGIDPGLLPHLFDLFVQGDRTPARTEGGLGIGLTMVRQLVELHDGRVEAHSEGSGRGSEFVVRVPLARADREGQGVEHEPAGPAVVAAAAAQAAGTSASSQCGSLCARKILVVEDNVHGAEVLAEVLSECGYEVLTAHEGQSAINLAAAWIPDVVLLDIGLPGMDGYEVARHLRGHDGLSETVLIALTGYGHEDASQRAAEAGVALHLVKPVDPEELLRVLAQVFSPAEGRS